MNYTIAQQEGEYYLFSKKEIGKIPKKLEFQTYREVIQYLYDVICDEDSLDGLGLSRLERTALQCFKDKVGIKNG